MLSIFKVNEVYSTTINGVEYLLEIREKHNNHWWFGIIVDMHIPFAYDTATHTLVFNGNTAKTSIELSRIHFFMDDVGNVPLVRIRRFLKQEYSGLDFTHISTKRDDRLPNPTFIMHGKIGLHSYAMYGYHPNEDDLIMAKINDFEWSEVKWEQQ